MGDNSKQLEESMKLQNRKEALEAKLLDKCTELRKLCYAEAELTGTLPIETPFEPEESPPKIRRRVGTMFPFTDEIIKELSNNNVLNVGTVPLRSSPRRKIPWGRALSLNQHSKLSASDLQQQRHTWAASAQPSSRTRVIKSKFNVAKKW